MSETLSKDRILLASLPEHEEKRRVRLVHRMSVALCVITLGLAITRFTMEGRTSILMLLVVASLGLGAASVFMRLGMRVELAGALLPVFGLGAIGSMILLDGGLLSEAVIWTPFAPLIATLAVGGRAALGFGLAGVGLLTGAYLVTPPELAALVSLELHLAGKSGATFFAGLLGYFYEAQRRLTQDELERTSRASVSLLDAFPDLLMVVDEKGHIHESYAEHLTNENVRRASYAGQQLSEVIPDVADEITEQMQTVLTHGEALTREYLATFLDQAYHIEVRMLLISQTRVLAAVRDFTAVREAERAREEFVAVVSHELRTPLTSIRGSIALLLQPELLSPEKTRVLLSIAERNVGRLGSILDDLLDIQKLDLGQMRLVPERLSVSELLESLCELHASQARARGVEIKLCCETEADIHADHGRILQLFGNLVTNASKFSSEGETVWIRARDHDDTCVEIDVCDHGPGVPDNEKKHVFQKFWQASKSNAKGWGLGLAISRAITELHGGSIEVLDNLSHGAIFRVHLPRSRSQS